ncbi:MAG: hypothetical protein U0172_01055 [Nitrospiraceae bacterium]
MLTALSPVRVLTALIVLVVCGGCQSMPTVAEQQAAVKKGDLTVHKISSAPILAEWGAPTYRSMQHVQFFPLKNGQWMPNFRVPLGDYPKDWDLTTTSADTLFWAYADRGEVLGFVEDRLVYREAMTAEKVHVLGKQWEREARFKTRLEGGALSR